MNNSIKYRFADFTIDNYAKIVKLAKSNYKIRSFNNYSDEENFVIWRHDIDFSIQKAYKLSCIENKEELKATYFINLHSMFYNVLEKINSDLIIKIIENGHDIGIHIDLDYYDIEDEKELEKYLKIESEIFSNYFNYNVKAFSYHNPTKTHFAWSKRKYCGLINPYSQYFQNEIEYISDSNGRWREESLLDVIYNLEGKKIQVLTHPGWWQDDILSPKERIWRCIDGRSEYVKGCYQDRLIKYKRPNIDQ